MSRLLLNPFLRSSRAAHIRPHTAMAFSTTSSTSSSSPGRFSQGPAPPRLPAEEQAEFERLQREAAVSSGFRVDDDSGAPAAAASPSTSPRHTTTATASAADASPTAATSAASSSSSSPTNTSSNPAHAQQTVPQTKGTDFNQGIFRGAPPEFEGDTNPRTGEVGGPKNEPLRWGGQGDWSYNGRVSDF